MRIYTRAQRPFVMGGKVHYHICTDAEATDPIDLGLARVRLVTSPKGTTFVVEAETGAIVGNTLEEVKQDLATASVAAVELQLAQAKLDSAAAEYEPPASFWRKLKEI